MSAPVETGRRPKELVPTSDFPHHAFPVILNQFRAFMKYDGNDEHVRVVAELLTELADQHEDIHIQLNESLGGIFQDSESEPHNGAIALSIMAHHMDTELAYQYYHEHFDAKVDDERQLAILSQIEGEKATNRIQEIIRDISNGEYKPNTSPEKAYEQALRALTRRSERPEEVVHTCVDALKDIAYKRAIENKLEYDERNRINSLLIVSLSHLAEFDTAEADELFFDYYHKLANTAITPISESEIISALTTTRGYPQNRRIHTQFLPKILEEDRHFRKAFRLFISEEDAWRYLDSHGTNEFCHAVCVAFAHADMGPAALESARDRLTQAAVSRDERERQLAKHAIDLIDGNVDSKKEKRVDPVIQSIFSRLTATVKHWIPKNPTAMLNKIMMDPRNIKPKEELLDYIRSNRSYSWLTPLDMLRVSSMITGYTQRTTFDQHISFLWETYQSHVAIRKGVPYLQLESKDGSKVEALMDTKSNVVTFRIPSLTRPAADTLSFVFGRLGFDISFSASDMLTLSSDTAGEHGVIIVNETVVPFSSSELPRAMHAVLVTMGLAMPLPAQS